ncbi:hypothetical protein BSKO_13686 [Bryopsis sp. KO-2023]|nr:hypothetical protein BSKO_13686 [Bryopsis sp. KO-2023]
MKNGLDEFEAYWPSWPKDVQGENLTNVYVGCGFDHLVELLWGRGSQFQMDFNKEVGFVDFQRTDWIDDYKNLPCLPGGFDWSVQESGPQDQQGCTDYSGMLRKVRSHNGGGAAFLGQFFKTEELQRCREFVAGERLVMEACVCTTAPFCDRFRAICRYDMERVREDACRLKIDFHIAYLQKVNGMTKVFMEKGARGGLIKNFEIYVQTLSNFVSLLSPEEIQTIQESSPVASLAAADPTQELSRRENDYLSERSTFVRWEGFACSSFRKFLEPKLDLAKSTIPFDKPPGPNILAPLFNTAPLSQILCILIFLVVVKFVLMVLGGLSDAMGLSSSGNIVVNSVSSIFDLPDTVGEVLTAAVVLEAVHWVLTTVGDFATESAREGSSAQADLADTPSPSSSAILESNAMTESQSHVDSEKAHVKERASSPSQGRNPPKGAGPGSNPAPSNAATSSKDSLVENGGLRPSSSVNLDEQEQESDFVEPPPSFIENTVSFFRLGIVTSALAVDIAISGMKGNHKGKSEQKDQESDKDEDSLMGSLPKEDPTIVVESVFENERLQPFRGWGHSWPGHFLPTDKCRHWSLQNPNSETVTTGMIFEEIECKLPDGWTWDDAEWKIDLSGRKTEAVDPDGWQYGVDFGWLKFPPEAGNGKRSGKFIRRRRWIRSRSKLPETPEAGGTSPRENDKNFSTDLVDSLNFANGQSKVPETRSRALARLSCDSFKAMSETSYFSGKPISSFASTNLVKDEDNYFAPPPETMHRRHSSGATTMERYFSVEDGFASLVQSFGENFNDHLDLDAEDQNCLDQKVDQLDRNKKNDKNNDSSSVVHNDESSLMLSRKSCPGSFPLTGNGAGKSDDLRIGGASAKNNPMVRSADNLDSLKKMDVCVEEEEEMKAWSDSEMATPRRVKDSGLGRFLIPSCQFREKIDDCGTQVNVAFGDSTARRRNKKQPQSQETPSSTMSQPLLVNPAEDTSWTSMEGGKWVEDCLSPRTTPSPSQSLEQLSNAKPDSETTQTSN